MALWSVVTAPHSFALKMVSSVLSFKKAYLSVCNKGHSSKHQLNYYWKLSQYLHSISIPLSKISQQLSCNELRFVLEAKWSFTARPPTFHLYAEYTIIELFARNSEV